MKRLCVVPAATLLLLCWSCQAARNSGSSFNGCGRKPNIRITDAADNIWPWVALVGKRTTGAEMEMYCNGVLINARWVITAANCLDRKIDLVRFGTPLLGTDYGVLRTIAHPDYIKAVRQGAQKHHNLGLIELTGDVHFSLDVAPVCLPWEDEGLSVVGKVLTLVTWGLRFADSGTPVKQLYEVKALPSSSCESAYAKVPQHNKGTFTEETTVCYGEPQGGDSDACQGTAGAAMVYPGRFRSYTLAAITTFGLGCDLNVFPAGGIPLGRSIYLDWIREQAFI